MMFDSLNLSNQRWRLRNADSTLRLFLSTFLIVLTIGYGIGLLFVDHTTSGTPKGLAEEFRGTPESAQATELKYEKGENEIYIFLHNHILSLSLVFFCVGGIFYFSSLVNDGLRKLLMVEPLVALVTTFGGIWLTRFVAPQFSWLAIISGITMVGCYLAMIVLMLIELWRKRS
ncbi:MAG: hypothetical protein HY033_09450 [Ignavibacteriae bacterium]|nr:hypothetical protein [Ignavibacteria bacterium]MBI3365118.1 hypothetical protein [Ignavibacteriota bacterium]